MNIGLIHFPINQGHLRKIQVEYTFNTQVTKYMSIPNTMEIKNVSVNCVKVLIPLMSLYRFYCTEGLAVPLHKLIYVI